MPRGWVEYAETKQAPRRTTPETAERKLIPKQWLRVGRGGRLGNRAQNFSGEQDYSKAGQADGRQEAW